MGQTRIPWLWELGSNPESMARKIQKEWEKRFTSWKGIGLAEKGKAEGEWRRCGWMHGRETEIRTHGE